MTEFWRNEGTVRGGGRFERPSSETGKGWFYGPKSDRTLVGRGCVISLGMLDPGDQRSQLGNELKWHGVWGVVHIWEAA